LQTAVDDLRFKIFVPPDPGTSFGARYLRALQEYPGVVLAHRDVVAALELDPRLRR
jgi:hypothetical protein